MKSPLVLRPRVLICLAALLCAATTARAGIFSDSLTIYDPKGKIVDQVIVTEEDEIKNGAGFVYALPLSTSLIDKNMLGRPTYIEEDPKTLSDVFGIIGINGSLFLAFASDVDGTTFPFTNNGNGFVFTETQPSYDATMYLRPDLQQQGWTATFISDTEATPEPSTIAAAVVGGLFALIAARRRRK